MAREELEDASDALREAGAAASGDARERLLEQADRLARLADRDRGPDHGRLAGHQNVLREIKDDVGEGGEAADLIDRASERITAYRETIEGV